MSVRSHLADFSGVAIASFIATAADGTLFAALTQGGGVYAGVAAFVAAVFGGAIHFSACRFVVFKRFEAPVQQSLPRYVLMSGAAAVIHSGFVTLLTGMATALVAWFISKGLVYVLWSYPLSRYFVFDGTSREA